MRAPRPSRGMAQAVAWACRVLVLASTVTCGRDGYLDPLPPEYAGEEPIAPPPPPLSTINVPMTIPVESLVELVEQAVPTRYGDLDHFRTTPDSGRARVAFELERAPFRAVFEEDVARLSTMILYRVRVRYNLPLLPDVESSCGVGDDPRPALAVSIESPLTLTRDWSLSTHARVADLRPATTLDVDRCTVTALGIDITDRLIEDAEIFLEEHLTAIDSIAASVDTRSRFVTWWSTLREPVELSDSLWLTMEPEAITRGPLHGFGDSLTVQLGLRSRPQIVFGDRPATPSTTLPPLDSGAVYPGLHLRVDARAEYGTASRFLKDAMAGRPIEMDERSIQVDSVEVYGIGGGRLAMRLGVSGDLHGRIYLTGRPVIDFVTGQVSVPDLELDVATRDAIFSVASWFAAPVLRDYLHERAVWPTKPAVEWLTMWLHRGLNRHLSEDLRVTGVVENVDIVGATALDDALLVRLAAHGFAQMHVD